MVLETERTFLVKYIPQDLKNNSFEEIEAIYIRPDIPGPALRIRRVGDTYEMTKKIQGNDASEQEEHTILLSKEEYEVLSKVQGKRIKKIRFKYPVGSKMADFDLYEDDLKGLAVVEFEFSSPEERDNFSPPDFCLVDVTYDEFISAKALSGKSYKEIEPILTKYNYQRL